jgi:hypothetical protein
MRNLCSVLAATALAAGALVLSGTAAFAEEKIPEKTIKSECKAAGGTYSTVIDGRNRYSTCEYTDISGEFWVDAFKNGKFVGTG